MHQQLLTSFHSSNWFQTSPSLSKKAQSKVAELEQNESFIAARSLHAELLSSLTSLNSLRDEFKAKLGKNYLKTMITVMDKISNELKIAKTKIELVDKEIAQDQKCILLAEKRDFFKAQCIEKRKQLEKVKAQKQQERERNIILNKQKYKLSNMLFQTAKQQKKYQIKIKSVSCPRQHSVRIENELYLTANPSRKTAREKQNPRIISSHRHSLAIRTDSITRNKKPSTSFSSSRRRTTLSSQYFQAIHEEIRQKQSLAYWTRCTKEQKREKLYGQINQ